MVTIAKMLSLAGPRVPIGLLIFGIATVLLITVSGIVFAVWITNKKPEGSLELKLVGFLRIKWKPNPAFLSDESHKLKDSTKASEQRPINTKSLPRGTCSRSPRRGC
jgi:hypothetical protein